MHIPKLPRRPESLTTQSTEMTEINTCLYGHEGLSGKWGNLVL